MNGDAARVLITAPRDPALRALVREVLAGVSADVVIVDPQPSDATDTPAPLPVEPKPVPERAEPLFYDGQVLPDGNGGPGYVLSNVTKYSATFRCAVPRVRGKARLKELKRQRHRLRNAGRL